MKSEAGRATRVGIFSDIHGNLHALETVLEELKKHNVDFTVCCGDVVGYGGNPNECIDLLRKNEIPTIAGNHDFAALSLVDIAFFNDVARQAMTWTREQLRPENMEFLRALPMSIQFEDMMFVHASPVDPELWNYVMTMGHARQAFQHFTERICFIGHSHTPFIVENCDNSLSCPDVPHIDMREGCRYLVNVGSVGQPRDRNPDAAYAIYDREKQHIEIHRVVYDIKGAQDNIRLQGLPDDLAERLTYGV
jgi:predicted phosphodiesterase